MGNEPPVDVAAVLARKRDANDRVARHARERSWRTDDPVIPFICECADPRCLGVAMRSLDEHEVARAESQPIVRPEHGAVATATHVSPAGASVAAPRVSRAQRT